jgi:preprotein translocase subunit SecY
LSKVASKFANITQNVELRNRLIFTLAMIAIYRVGVFIPLPGVNRASMSQMVAGSGGGFMGLLNLFTGGAFEMASVFALGIMPYISASIILQLMTVVVPAVERLQKEGEQGRKKINQYTRYGTVLLSAIQGFGISFFLENQHNSNPELGLLVEPGWTFRLMTVITLTAGTVFVMWLGEQITERGVGNGISLIITASILAGFPAATFQVFTQAESGSLSTFAVVLIGVIALATTAFIAFFESAQRRIPLQYAKRMVGRRIYGGQSHHLPLKVNMAGVIPPIFSSSILIFPSTIASYFDQYPIAQWVQNALIPGDWRYNVLYTVLNIFFCFFYTAVQVNPVDMADNLKKADAFVPGIRPGKKTAEYIDAVMSRLTAAGAVYISAVCLMPFILQDKLGISFYLGGMSLLITVSVGLDTVNQIENHMITRHYDDFGSRASAGATGKIAGRDEDES